MTTVKVDPEGPAGAAEPGAAEPNDDATQVSQAPAEGALAGILGYIPKTFSGSEITNRIAQWALPGLLIIFIVGFSAAKPSEFATWTNARTILYSQSISLIVALAALVPLLAGEVDISVGGVLGAAAILAAYGYAHHWDAAVIVIATLGFGLVIGLCNLLLVVVAGINSFIATLGMTTVLQGVADLISGNQTMYQGIPNSLNEFVANRVFGIPLLVIYALIFTIFSAYLTSKTPYGRLLRASGSGREAAKLIGVNTKKYVGSAFLISGLVSAAAGYLETANLQSADPSTGSSFMLSAIAAVFLGAILSKRGHLNAFGTLLAVLVLGVGITGLTMIGAPEWVPQVFNGVALIVALLVSRAGGRGISGGLTG
jgi:ribose transport system permease protein